MYSSNLIQTNAMCVLNNNWRDFYFVCFSIFICLKAITNLKNKCGQWSDLMLLHQILNHIPASLDFVTCLFPARKEPLEKHKAAASSSVRATPLPYDLSAFKAAGAHQFSCSEI